MREAFNDKAEMWGPRTETRFPRTDMTRINTDTGKLRIFKVFEQCIFHTYSALPRRRRRMPLSSRGREGINGRARIKQPHREIIHENITSFLTAEKKQRQARLQWVAGTESRAVHWDMSGRKLFLCFSDVELLDLGSWTLDRGPWILDLGSWIVDLGSWIVDLGSWTVDLGNEINWSPCIRTEEATRNGHHGECVTDSEPRNSRWGPCVWFGRGAITRDDSFTQQVLPVDNNEKKISSIKWIKDGARG